MAWPLLAVQKVFIYLLVGIAFTALCLGDRALSPAVIALCLAAGVGSWFWEPPRISFARYASLWMPLTVSVLVSLAALVLAGVLPLSDGAIGLVLYLTGAKLFQRERAADHIQLAVLSLLLMAIATLFNEDISFGFLFLLYVGVGLVNLTLYHLRLQAEQHPQAASQVRGIDLSFLGFLGSLALLATILSVVLFFLFPRLSLGILGRQARSPVMTTGFAEEVSLGEFGTLKTDNTVALRVEFPAGVPPQVESLYWRGISFDRYDGRAWSRTLNRAIPIFPTAAGVFDLSASPLIPTASDLQFFPLEQRIYLEPLATTTVFGVAPLLEVEWLDRGGAMTPQQAWQRQTRRLLLHESGDVSHSLPPRLPYLYRAVSWIPRDLRPRLRQLSQEELLSALDPAQQAAYLQLPAELDPRIPALAEEITAGIPDVFGKVTALQNYLLENYAYTTDLPDPGAEPPLEAFLFTHRRGHCEYFATALTVLARSLGIPARVVNGFLGGRWVAQEKYLAVRNADAHSWTEIPFGSYGWVIFDATPAEANVSQRQSGWDPLQDFYDSLRFRWFKYVIQYDLSTQRQIWRQIQELASRVTAPQKQEDVVAALRRSLVGWGQSLQQNSLPLVGVMVITGFTAYWGRRRRYQAVRWQDGAWILLATAANGVVMGSLWQPPPPWPTWMVGLLLPSLAFAGMRWIPAALPKSQRRRQVISRLYLQLRDLATAVGIPAHLGPEACLEHLRQADLPQVELAIRFLQRYLEVRFGGIPLEAGELQRWQHHLRQLRRSWQAKSSTPAPERTA
ncbi:protease [Synechococcus sp. 60AY4M2]|uniref:transglutaminase TgpA family protein n=1 Tax=unclassified Synechococcus TaxID=2626047 RepID=UPI000C188892|nr:MULTISPECIES: transglutaminaseTgpA domain-containing protein [unclassified Synechococcus]PIK94687.1 protease [Synechococcus sp. 60AY4M2]PIK99365.1 protease [Synechococcus sp. 65AY640]